jgi:hypothetical protein
MIVIRMMETDACKIDDSNTINLKLFPTRPPPPPILAHQVPILTVSLSSLQSPISSDLTLNRVLPYINGVNSTARIAQLADTDLSLTRRAIQHLVYYGCLVLLDVFSFGAIYAPTAEIGGFVIDDDVKEECARYIRVPRLRIGSDAKTIRLGSDTADSTASSTTSHDNDATPSSTPVPKPSTANDSSDTDEWHIPYTTLIHLYTSLRQGLTLKNWVLQNLDALQGIDVRRFITFGIIKGFLYRVHKYAIATTTALPPAPPTSLATSTVFEDGGTVRGHNPSVSHAHAQHPSFSLHRPSGAGQQKQDVDVDGDGLHTGEGERENALPLLKFLDGMHCFDEMCTELGLSEKVVEGKVRGMGEGLGVVIQR